MKRSAAEDSEAGGPTWILDREFGVIPNSATWRRSGFASGFASATSGRGMSELLGVSKVRPANQNAPTIAPNAQTPEIGLRC
jgi:hypothetical protein